MRRVRSPRNALRTERDVGVDHHPIDGLEQRADQVGLDHALEHHVAVALERGEGLART